MGMNNVNASKATISRMPAYLRFLREEFSKGMKYISSAYVATEMDVSAILVRKDFALVSSVSGKPRLGFEITRLIQDIERFLGYDSVRNAVIVGAGGLGKAFLGYEGFKKYGMNVLAAFDVSKEVIGEEFFDKKVYDVKEMEAFIRENDVSIGIITVPKKFAQSICDELVRCGIKGVWNFAPIQLDVPYGVALKTEDLASSLAILSAKIMENSLEQ